MSARPIPPGACGTPVNAAASEPPPVPRRPTPFPGSPGPSGDGSRRFSPWWICAVGALLFAALTWQVADHGPLRTLDERLGRALASGELPAGPAEFAADLGNTAVALPVLCVVMVWAGWQGWRGRSVAVPGDVAPVRWWLPPLAGRPHPGRGARAGRPAQAVARPAGPPADDGRWARRLLSVRPWRHGGGGVRGGRAAGDPSCAGDAGGSPGWPPGCSGGPPGRMRRSWPRWRCSTVPSASAWCGAAITGRWTSSAAGAWPGCCSGCGVWSATGGRVRGRAEPGGRRPLTTARGADRHPGP